MEKLFPTVFWGSSEFPFYPVMIDSYFQVFRFSILINAFMLFTLLVFLSQKICFHLYGNVENKPSSAEIFYHSVGTTIIYMFLFWTLENLLVTRGGVILFNGVFLLWMDYVNELTRQGAISILFSIIAVACTAVGRFIIFIVSFGVISYLVKKKFSKFKIDSRTSLLVSIASVVPLILLLASVNFVYASKDFQRERKYIQAIVNWEFYFDLWKDQMEGRPPR